jgi:hypothetical protein
VNSPYRSVWKTAAGGGSQVTWEVSTALVVE